MTASPPCQINTIRLVALLACAVVSAVDMPGTDASCYESDPSTDATPVQEVAATTRVVALSPPRLSGSPPSLHSGPSTGSDECWIGHCALSRAPAAAARRPAPFLERVSYRTTGPPYDTGS
jgi:hypothetical protein